MYLSTNASLFASRRHPQRARHCNLPLREARYPLSEVETIISPVLEVETHILQNLNIPEETLRFYFGSARGCWASLGFALYSMQQKHIQFSQLPQDRRLPALRYLISRILGALQKSWSLLRTCTASCTFCEDIPGSNITSTPACRLFLTPKPAKQSLHRSLSRQPRCFAKWKPPFCRASPAQSRASKPIQTPAFCICWSSFQRRAPSCGFQPWCPLAASRYMRAVSPHPTCTMEFSLMPSTP